VPRTKSFALPILDIAVHLHYFLPNPDNLAISGISIIKAHMLVDGSRSIK
jgi:hypothetical protein